MDPYIAFRSRDFRLLLTGGVAATFGLQMMGVAVSWDLYIQTRSAAVLGNIGFVQVAPFLLFALAAGDIADRYDRRRIMIGTQLVLAAASAVLVFAPRGVATIYVCLFLASAARAFQTPARSAILPAVVPPGALPNAITWNSSGSELASVSGPALAGLLVAAAGTVVVYWAQLVCTVITLLCFGLLRFRPEANRVAPLPGRRALVEGIRFVWRDKLILSAVSLDMFAVLFGGAIALLPIYAVEVLHAGARSLGWLRAAPSLGAITMALLMAHHPPARRAGVVLLGTVAGFGAATIVFGLSRFLWLSIVMLALTGAFDNVSVVLRQSLVQTKTPDALRGRVLAVNSIFISCSNQLGAVESGWTAAWFGAVPSVVGGGIATLIVVAAFAAGSSALRNWRQDS